MVLLELVATCACCSPTDTGLFPLPKQRNTQESHCSPVQQLDVNLCDASCRNLFATVGKDQVLLAELKCMLLQAVLLWG